MSHEGIAVKAFVSDGALSKVVVEVIDDGVIELLLALGFSVEAGGWQKKLTIIAPDQEFKIELFGRLRDEGICFSAGPGWSPAEVFEFLRDQNMLTGTYRKIAWDGPGKPRVIENC